MTKPIDFIKKLEEKHIENNEFAAFLKRFADRYQNVTCAIFAYEYTEDGEELEEMDWFGTGSASRAFGLLAITDMNIRDFIRNARLEDDEDD